MDFTEMTSKNGMVALSVVAKDTVSYSVFLATLVLAFFNW
jgi:hypothetical protein